MIFSADNAIFEVCLDNLTIILVENLLLFILNSLKYS